MFLQRLVLANFKNHVKTQLQFSNKINCFTGANGSGKTNLLDAIYYLCITRSYFNATDQYNVKQGESYFRLDAVIERKGEEHELKCTYQLPRKKELIVDDDKRTRLSDHVGEFPVIMIAPDDNLLINGGSEERRKFIDGLLAQVDRKYLEALQAYNKIISQRNAWLKAQDGNPKPDLTMLEAYDEQLAKPANLIFEKRSQFVEDMLPHFAEAYAAISGDRESVELKYVSPLQQKPFKTWLIDRRQQDLILGRTTKGIHRDDLEFIMNGMVVKTFGSQGQQKSYLLSLKLAQYRILAKAKGLPPFLLLDDIFDKLDPQRCANLLQYIDGHEFGQIFITDTQRSKIEGIFTESDQKPAFFEIANGQIQD